MRITGLALIVVAAITSAAAQSLLLPPFEVLSVKRNSGIGMGKMSGASLPGQLRIVNIPLHVILLEAYGVREDALVGSPTWARDERFDLVGTFPPEAIADRDGYRRMLEKALVERFGLKSHRETRSLPIYRLIMARSDRRLGPDLKPSTVDCAQWLAEKKPRAGAGTPSRVAPGGRRPACDSLPTRHFIAAGSQPISALARSLESLTGRFVVDETGLKGNFDYDLEFTRTLETGSIPTARDGQPSIFTALQEQLGLKLESDRRPMPVVVIDAISRPTPD
jgi:uncharacterized protein (TIGR03435 family)